MALQGNDNNNQLDSNNPNEEIATEIVDPNELGLTTDEPDADPVREQYQTQDFQDKWKDEFESARKELKDFHKTGNKTIARFIDKRTDNESNVYHTSHFNLFYANTEIKQAALFAMPPDPAIGRRYDEPADDVSRVAALILQRNIVCELDLEQFVDTGKAIVTDMLVPGVGIGWARFEQQGGETQTNPHPNAGQVYADPLTGQPKAFPTTVETQAPVTDQCSPIDYVPWDDLLWSPCRIWPQCRWVARRIPMDKDAIIERFGSTVDEDVIENLSFDTKETDNKNSEQKTRPQHSLDKTCDVYEVWDKQRKLVWWIAEGADVPLDVREDTNEFEGFFPTPLPPLGRFSTSNTVPVSDFYMVQDLYNQVDDLNNRIARLIDAMQFKFVYDAQSKSLQDLYTTTNELQGVPVDKWLSFVTERGGLQGSIQTTASILVEQATAFKGMIQARDLIVAQIDQIEGITEIMHGEAVPNETILQTATKSAFGTSRLSIKQQMVANYVAALLRLKAQLICKFYSAEILMQRAGTFSQADQQFIQPAIQLLKDKQMRGFKLSVSVDSIQLPNWNLEKQERTDAFKAIMGSLSQMGPMLAQEPQIAPIALKLVSWMVAGYKGSEDIQGDLTAAWQQVTQMLAQKQKQPQPNPGQIQQTIAQGKDQTDLQIAQETESTKRLKIQTEAATAKDQQQVDMAQIRVDEAKVQTNALHDQLSMAHDHTHDKLSLLHDQKEQQPDVLPVPVPIDPKKTGEQHVIVAIPQ